MKKIQTKQTYRCVYTRSQKIKGWLAFIMLFVCGVMVGTGIAQKNVALKQKADVQQTEQKEKEGGSRVIRRMITIDRDRCNGGQPDRFQVHQPHPGGGQ